MCGLFAGLGQAASHPAFEAAFASLRHRGPDATEIIQLDGRVTLAFHRLAIIDTSHAGDQPFHSADRRFWLMCNGEIYNHTALRAAYQESYAFASHSDCEVILPLFAEFGIAEAARRLDAEFALIIWDSTAAKLYAARDPLGIRPLFYGFNSIDGGIVFASEAKALTPLCLDVRPFPPGHYYDGAGNFIAYRQISHVPAYSEDSPERIALEIRERLIEAVRKRLLADVPVGYLLSGGLDSSLVCGIAAHVLKQPLSTFAVGLNHHPIDLPYARKVAEHIGSSHHEILFNQSDTLACVTDVIRHTETWDITTIRASIGMYLLCRNIRANSSIKVLLTGEVSDELFGYKYTDFAPNAQAFQAESVKRIDELYCYDVLRADRCIAAHSLEARVPFADLDFVSYCMAIPPEFKMNTKGIGKYLLRKAFDGMGIVPEEILWREKAAFSDAVGHSMVEYLKTHAESLYSDVDLALAGEKYPYATPFSKESLWYRDLFESHYPGRAELIPAFWMPNQAWPGCAVNDPSARVLSNYGASGH
jgi:asparagine synthase (glutamine-hydrolysing)